MMLKLCTRFVVLTLTFSWPFCKVTRKLIIFPYCIIDGGYFVDIIAHWTVWHCPSIMVSTVSKDDQGWCSCAQDLLLWPWPSLKGARLNAGSYLVLFENMILLVCLINKRPLGLTGLLSNNTLCMIHSPMNTKWDLIWPLNATQGQMSWGKLKDHIWFTIYVYVFHATFYMMLNLGDTTFWKSCDLDLTLKSYPRSNVLR